MRAFEIMFAENSKNWRAADRILLFEALVGLVLRYEWTDNENGSLQHQARKSRIDSLTTLNSLSLSKLQEIVNIINDRIEQLLISSLLHSILHPLAITKCKRSCF